MGRHRSKDHDLPPRMYRRGDRYFYQNTIGQRKRIWLGIDLIVAKRKWAELEGREQPQETHTFAALAKKYLEEVIPQKAAKTQTEDQANLKRVSARIISPAIDRAFL